MRGATSRFFEAYDTLFANVGGTPAAKIAAVATATGLDADALTTCVGAERPAVERAAAEARRLGVSGTPSFFAGTLDSSGMLTVTVAHQGAWSGSKWLVQLLRPVVEAARP